METFEVGLMYFCMAISLWGPGSVMCLFEKKNSPSKGMVLLGGMTSSNKFITVEAGHEGLYMLKHEPTRQTISCR